MRILVSGASGLVGSAIVRRFASPADEVVRLVRRESRPGPAEVPWNPEAGTIATEGLEGLDAVVHLAGENLGTGRWTRAKKDRIRTSRVEGTRLLASALAGLKRPPRVLISASAVGSS